jgi:ligand-binding sensor domain-containing protein
LKRQTLILFVFVSQFLLLQSYAQSIQYRNFTSKDGLISNQVYNLFQDDLGHIWIFSKYGTVKFNGDKFIPVLKNLPLREAFMFSHFQNPNNHQIIVANSRANVYKIENDEAIRIKGFENISKTLRENVSEITSIYADTNDNLSLYSKNLSFKLIRQKASYFPIEISKFNEKDSALYKLNKYGKFIYMACNRSLKDEFVLKDSKSNLYLKSFDNRYFKINHDRTRNSHNNVKLKNNEIYYSNVSILIKLLSNNQVKEINIGARITSFAFDNKNHIWVGTVSNGIFELNDKDSIVNHFLSNTTVNDVLMAKACFILKT